MQVQRWILRAMAIGIAAAGVVVAGNEETDVAQAGYSGKSVIVRSEYVQDPEGRKQVIRRVIEEAAALSTADESGDGRKGEDVGEGEPVETSLAGPAGGVRLSVRGQLPSGFVYRRAEAERPGVAACGGVAAPAPSTYDEASTAESGEVRP